MRKVIIIEIILLLIFILFVFITSNNTSNNTFLRQISSDTLDDDVEIVESENGSDICVFMCSDKNSLPYYKYTIDINKKYCDEHNYDFKAYIGRTLSKNKYVPHFERYNILRRLVQTTNYKYFMYIDSDAIFQSNDNLDKFITQLEGDKIILASEDVHDYGRIFLPLNSGVLVVKNDPKIIEIMNRCLDNDFGCFKKLFYDQDVLEHLKEYHKHFILLPYGVLQTFDFKDNESLIKHAAGTNKEERELIFKTIWTYNKII